MIRSVCMICGVQYGTKEDGSEGVRDSHGYCQRHYDEAMIAIQNEFAKLPMESSKSGDREYLNSEEVGDMIGRSAGAVRNLVLRRKIPFRKPGGRLAFIRSEIIDWIDNSSGMSIDIVKDQMKRRIHMKQNKSLDARDKVKLILWMRDNKEFSSKATLEQIKEKYNNETGSSISLSSIQTYRNEIAPKFVKDHDNHLSKNGNKLSAKIRLLKENQNQLDDQIKSLASEIYSKLADISKRVDGLETFKRLLEG